MCVPALDDDHGIPGVRRGCIGFSPGINDGDDDGRRLHARYEDEDMWHKDSEEELTVRVCIGSTQVFICIYWRSARRQGHTGCGYEPLTYGGMGCCTECFVVAVA